RLLRIAHQRLGCACRAPAGGGSRWHDQRFPRQRWIAARESRIGLYSRSKGYPVGSHEPVRMTLTPYRSGAAIPYKIVIGRESPCTRNRDWRHFAGAASAYSSDLRAARWSPRRLYQKDVVKFIAGERGPIEGIRFVHH